MKIFLLCILWMMVTGIMVFPAVHILYLHVHVMKHRAMMHQSPDQRENSLVIDLSLDEYTDGLLSDKEIMIRDRRYDITSKERTNAGKIRLTVQLDEYEELLLREIVTFHHSRDTKDESLRRMITPDWIAQSMIIQLPPDEFRFRSFPFYLLCSIPNKDWLSWSPPPEEMI